MTPEDVLGVFDSAEGPTITTADVVDALGRLREVARNRLNDLVERELVARLTSGRVVLRRRIDADEENPYLRGFGVPADTDVPEGVKGERERAGTEWAERGDDRSRQ